jgi:hypothetical protein
VDRTGELEWHDHRIHWMSPVKPPEVTDVGKRTKIFNWSVPIKVGTQTGTIHGELFWVPQNSKTPLGAIIALVVIVLLGAVLVVAVRRRRARSSPPGQRANRADESSAAKEAW